MADENTQAQQEQEAPAQEENENTEQNAGGEKKTDGAAPRMFSQDEVNKIVSERQKRWEKKAADERAEAERVAKMSAEEKAKHDHEKREKALSDREAELTRREMTAAAKEKLAELKLPAELLSAVDISSEQTISESAGAIAKAFSEAVSAEVEKRLASPAPKKGAHGTPADPFRTGLGI